MPAGFEFWTQFGLEIFHLYAFHIFATGETCCTGYLGQGFLVGRRKVDHQENALGCVRAGAVQTLGIGCERSKNLSAAVCILKVQRNDVGQTELAA